MKIWDILTRSNFLGDLNNQQIGHVSKMGFIY